jgi:hypothetical protein
MRFYGYVFALAFALTFAACTPQPYEYDYPCTASYARWGAHVGWEDTCYAYRAGCGQNQLPEVECWP